MNPKQSNRRRFLKEGAALAGLAVGAIRSASGQALKPEAADARPVDGKDLDLYGERSRFETSVRWKLGKDPAHARLYTPLQDSEGIITPNSLHGISSRDRTCYGIDPRQHRLLIHGLVDRPLIFTLEELKRLPSVSRIHFIECVGNGSLSQGRWKWETVQQTHGKMGCAEWTGVLLSVLLQMAGVQKGASWIIAESADGVHHQMSITVEKAMDDAMVAYGQNGEPVRPETGYPMRLLVPGWEGVRNVKWLRRLKVVDQPVLSKEESGVEPILTMRLDGKASWFSFEMGTESVITFPAPGGRPLSGRGYYQISGLAWSGCGAIRRVEVSTDGGKTWKDAQLQEPVHRIAHTRFRFVWNWNGEETVLLSRSTDDQGNVQPSLAEFAKMWGVEPDYFRKTTNRVHHFNAIYPSKVTQDGSVRYAMYES